MWRDPLGFVVLVTVWGGGAIGTVWPAAGESMGYVVVGALLVHAWWGFEQGSEAERRALTWCSLAWVGTGLAAAFAGFLISSDRGSDTAALPLTISLLIICPPAMVVGLISVPDVMHASTAAQAIEKVIGERRQKPRRSDETGREMPIFVLDLVDKLLRGFLAEVFGNQAHRER